MKSQKFVTMLILCISASVNSLAQPNLSYVVPKKIYVDSQNVKVSPKGIVVTAINHRFTFKAIRSNKDGLFVLRKDLLSPAKKLLNKRIYKCDRCLCTFHSEEALAWHYLEKHT